MKYSVIFIAALAWISVSRASVVQEEQLKIVGQKLAKLFNPVMRSQQRQSVPQCVAAADATCNLESSCGESTVFPMTNGPTNFTGGYNCAFSDFCQNGYCAIPHGRNVCMSNCFTAGETYDKNFTFRFVVYYRSENMEYTLEDVTETVDISDQPFVKGCTECYSSSAVIEDNVPTGRYIIRQSHIPEEGKLPLFDFIYEYTVFTPQKEDPTTTTPKDNGGATMKNSLYILLITVSSLLLRSM